MTALLEHRTWHTIRSASLAHGLGFDTRQTKQQGYERLRCALLGEGRLRRAYRALTSEEREPLIALRMGRIRFLHYAAHAAGLIAPHQPTTQAWAWLAQGSPWNAIWKAITRDLHARHPLWQQYRLPEYLVSIPLRGFFVARPTMSTKRAIAIAMFQSPEGDFLLPDAISLLLQNPEGDYRFQSPEGDFLLPDTTCGTLKSTVRASFNPPKGIFCCLTLR